MYTTIQTLWNKGHNKSQISELTGHDWKTVAKVIKAIKAGNAVPKKKPHPCLLDPYKEELIGWIEQGLTAVRMHEELLRLGIKVSYSTVKNSIADTKRNNNIFIRMHTDPGEEAQVDFGYVGYTLDNSGRRRKTWVFNMRLSFSRLDYYEKVYDQKVETFILCHIHAFQHFGGVPKSVKIDNLKAAILEANFYEPIYQRLYKQFAEHYGFQSIPCRIYSPNDKGKVESGIKYVKNNFFAGRSFKDGSDVDQRLAKWLERANSRIHGTTKKVPQEVFETQEKKMLLKLPVTEFNLSKVGTRKVYHDCHIYINHNYYSVPYKYIGKEVEIERGSGVVRIYFNHEAIALHEELTGKGEFSTQKSHYPKYKCLSDTEYQEKYQAKMAEVGNFVEQIFFCIVQYKKQAWSRPVQGVLSLVKRYSSDIVNRSCERALAYGAYDYQIIKRICENGSYNLPVEFSEE